MGELKCRALAKVSLATSLVTPFFHVGSWHSSEATKTHVLCMRQQGQTSQSTLQKSLWKRICGQTYYKKEKKKVKTLIIILTNMQNRAS